MGLFRVPVTIQQTLNVTITASSVTLNVDIVAQTVGNVAIDISAQTIGNVAVNIAASITLNTSIVASSVTISVSIVSATVTIDVDIVAQTLGNININIAASSATLLVSIVASSVTINISVVAQTINLNIDFAEQTIAIRDEEIFETFAANDLDISGVILGVVGGTITQILSHTVPAGETLYIYDWGFYVEPNSGDGAYNCVARIRRATPSPSIFGLTGGAGGFAMTKKKPFVLTSAQVVVIDATHALAGNRNIRAYLSGVEL